MSNTEQILSKGAIVDNKYTIQFYAGDVPNGQVYRAKNNNNQIVRIKVYNASKYLAAHFTKEGELLEQELLSKIRHPNIISVIDSGEFTQGHNLYRYLVTDFISGESLSEKMKREGSYSQYSAVPIIIQILSAIEYLHSATPPILYNSVSLENIVLDYSNKSEQPILTNFLNARYFTSNISKQTFDNVSPFYLAPEAFNGIITPQCDLFAIGALLYHMIMGVPPWHIAIPNYRKTDEKTVELIGEAREKKLSFLKVDNTVIDDHLKDIISKALALNIDNRFKSASEFSKALLREASVKTLSTNKETNSQPKANKKKGGGFSDIAGMTQLKEILYNDVIRAINETELYESYGVTIPNGMLLYGPPGCGKTFISEKFAEEVGFNFVQLKPSDIKSRYVNATEERINEIFSSAIEHAPTVIFIDEIDAIVPNRDGDLHHMHASAVNELLAQMTNCADKGIFIIAATNRPEKIDPAMVRTGRIDKLIYVPPPDKTARAEMFKLYLRKRPIDISLDYESLAEKTDNYVSSDIKFLCDEASRKALASKSRISMDILATIIASNPPSVSNDEIRRYNTLRSELELSRNGNNTQEKRNPIGFNTTKPKD